MRWSSGRSRRARQTSDMDASRIRSQASEVQRALTSPQALIQALGLEYKRTSTTRYQIRCPWHADSNPSCHVFVGGDGTVRVHCFPCGKSGNAITLARAVLGLGFRDGLVWCARTANQYALADEIQGGRDAPALPERPKLPPPRPMVERPYPNPAEVRALLDGCLRATRGPAHDYLRGRNIEPHGKLLVLRADQELPTWASKRDPDTREPVSWLESGHRLILPAYDIDGQLRSVRAWRIPSLDCRATQPEDTPKRLPPAGKRASGLCLMTPQLAVRIRNGGWPGRALVVEGEPDFLAAHPVSPIPTIGWLSGSTPPPPHVALVIATHPDPAGNRYAADLASSRQGWPHPMRSPGPFTPSLRLHPPSDLSDLSRQELCQLLASIHH
jgi:hypothetical protein